MKALAVALIWPFVVAACASPDTGGEPSRSPSPSPTSQLDPGPVPIGLFNQIVLDAANRADVEPSAFTVVTAEAVTWSDGSMGCPEPGMFYTQALVEGYQVVLEVDGTQYDYHAGARGGFALCPPERSKPPVGGGDI